MKFLEAFTNIFRIPDLRKRLMFALALLAVYRVGGHIPIPGLDAQGGQPIGNAPGQYPQFTPCDLPQLARSHPKEAECNPIV